MWRQKHNLPPFWSLSLTSSWKIICILLTFYTWSEIVFFERNIDICSDLSTLIIHWSCSWHLSDKKQHVCQNMKFRLHLIKSYLLFTGPPDSLFLYDSRFYFELNNIPLILLNKIMSTSVLWNPEDLDILSSSL